MNIALSSLVIILLLLPGLLFRTFLIKSDSFENPLDTSIKAELGIVLIASLFLHFLGYGVILCLGYLFDFGQFYHFLTASKYFNTDCLNGSWHLFLFYIVILSVSSAFIGVAFKLLILRNYWDLRFKFLQITNEWDNILSGRLYHFDRIVELKSKRKSLLETKIAFKKKFTQVPESAQHIIQLIDQQLQTIEQKLTQKVDFVIIDALTETRSDAIIYKGKLFKYYLSRNNSLDKIVLKSPFRRKFIDPSVEKSVFNPPEFYEFESKLFVINYNEIKNLNVRVVYIDKIAS